MAESECCASGSCEVCNPSAHGYPIERRAAEREAERARLPVGPDQSGSAPRETDREPQCRNGHPFVPGIDVDMEREDRQPDPRWCNTCGESTEPRAVLSPEAPRARIVPIGQQLSAGVYYCDGAKPSRDSFTTCGGGGDTRNFWRGRRARWVLIRGTATPLRLCGTCRRAWEAAHPEVVIER